MSPPTIFFLVAALVTAVATFLNVSRMANRIKRTAPTERSASIFVDLPRIIREHNRLFPRSERMLAFWLSIIFLLVWLTCFVLSLAIHL